MGHLPLGYAYSMPCALPTPASAHVFSAVPELSTRSPSESLGETKAHTDLLSPMFRLARDSRAVQILEFEAVALAQWTRWV